MMKRIRDRRPRRACPSHCEGSAALEFGLLVPLLVTLLLGCAEIGYFIQQTMAVNSAMEAGIAAAARRGFDAKAITSAILNNSALPGLTATPAPALFCGCPAANGITPTPCDGSCAGDLVPGHYVKMGAELKPQSIMPSGMFPLPALITAQSTTRLN